MIFRQGLIDPVVVTLVVSYIAFDQLRQELVLKRSMQLKIRELKLQTDQLRRQEIERIGRDLHDQIGNTLAAALGYLGRGSGSLQKPTELITSAIGELRFLSHNLVKDNDRPLTDKVETLVSRFNDFSAIRLVFQDYTHKKIDQLHATRQQNIYSIIQELLTNIVLGRSPNMYKKVVSVSTVATDLERLERNLRSNMSTHVLDMLGHSHRGIQ